MAVKFVLILSVIAQLTAAGLALRLNQLYRRRSAWIFISAAAIVMTIGRATSLVSTWGERLADAEADAAFWTESLIGLLVSILLVAGIALIEPLFVELHKAEALLRRDKKRLEQVVRRNEDELRIARQIQENLFPDEPPDIKDYDVAGASKPAEWASGDYFDYIPMHDGSHIVVVADVSGHGIGPALLMSETRAFLRSLAQTRNDIGEILTLANHAVAQDVEEGRFVTIFMARLESESSSTTYTSAGHNAYLLRANGEGQVLSPTGIALGIDENAVMNNSQPIQLERGDLMLLVTDGILETTDAEGTLFGEERLFEVARQSRDGSAFEVVESIFKAADDFSASSTQKDDNTAVVVKYR
ncbi:Phosphoserine phosphatase RsbU [Symmachiella dynata]|uniref:PP2C family protein-serine/threonine phosphatase n=1 Tax=Symmachiella dynata TaxID=2527995 RepID=UPI00118C9CB0|nr:SpoIIE family protein phosphatase [Symmachiella dynata]QDT51088.1 Phosphoserine phosphatase RsbU [Symmachiella dynata]